jgi:hypothetical protein
MTREDRAEARRRSWSGGVATPQTHSAMDREFWRTASGEQRLAAVWEMAEQQWHYEHPNGPALRLDRSVGGVRRYRG